MTKLLAIVGPTASGKTGLAIKVARDFNAEIVCADSRTIYRGLDIGTAKPTQDQQAAVPHHLLDIINPDQSFSASEFKQAANEAIVDIQSRGKLPILVGGSGLYINAVIYDYQFPAGADNQLRQQLQQLSVDELVQRLQQLDPEAAATIDLKNTRRVVRAIETAGLSRTQSRLLPGTLLVGLRPSEEQLSINIKQRTDEMLSMGLVDEVKATVLSYGSELEVVRSPGYAEVVNQLKGQQVHELADLIDLHTRQLAKRQLTWFKRDNNIHWFDDPVVAFDYIAKQLTVQ